MRKAAVVLVLILATSTASCGRVEPVIVRPAHSPTPAPDLARVVCEKDGSTTLLTDSVEAQPDGVHVEVDNRTGEPLSLNGFGWDFGEGTERAVTSIPPGRIKVACYPFSMHEGPSPKGLDFTIEDPHGYWVSPELECPTDMVGSTISDFGPGSGQKGDPVDLTRENLRGLRPGDSVERAGYPEGEDVAVRVVRDGAVVATTGFHRATGGGWNMGSSDICASVGIRDR